MPSHFKPHNGFTYFMAKTEYPLDYNGTSFLKMRFRLFIDNYT